MSDVPASVHEHNLSRLEGAGELAEDDRAEAAEGGGPGQGGFRNGPEVGRHREQRRDIVK